jgi:hypothetical protein
MQATEEQAEMNRDHQDSLSLHSTSHRLLLANSHLREIMEIQPIGLFHYQPDSGFRGSATHVRVVRNHQTEILRADSSRQLMQQSNRTASQRQQRFRETADSHSIDKRSTGIPWKAWIPLLLLAVIYTAWRLWRR